MQTKTVVTAYESGDHVTLVAASGLGKLLNMVQDDLIQRHGTGPFTVRGTSSNGIEIAPGVYVDHSQLQPAGAQNSFS